MKCPIPAHTITQQARAAQPAASAWVSANAGSGKTHVLTQRVVRLLLDGVAPARSFFLRSTFTKAAAANMSLRVFDTLSDWTRLDDAALVAAIVRTGLHAPDRATLLRARRLFARAVETPGGLKIQTIHAFCERLLHLFPFEANVAAGFEALDEAEQAELLAQARAQTLIEAVRDEATPLARAVRTIAAETSENGLGDLIREALGARAALMDSLRAHGDDIDAWTAALARHLRLAPGEDEDAIDRSILDDGIAASRWANVAASLPGCGKRLAAALALEGEARRAAYLDVFLTKKLEARAASYIAKKDRAQFPDLAGEMDAEQARLCALLDRRKRARLVARSAALVLVIDKILRDYADRKAMRGRLDFADMIERTRTLLTRAGAGWVLYKLDAGIDHILVDEAQDTSPAQWDILRILAEEFTAGAGAHSGSRTFFAVGDEKQSIYSFQGAAPDMFDQMRRDFQKRIEAAAQSFEHVRLNLSFRSVPQILSAVDGVFAPSGNYSGVVADADVWISHDPLKRDLPGLVEIWDLEAAQAADDPSDWRMPLDRFDERDPPVIVARRIAATIAAWLRPDAREAVHDNEGAPRAIAPGDILILVRTRGPFFEAIIRALKDARVAVAGADRLVLTEHIAVMDLVAAGRAALLPEDDLTLACVLKSPLIGLDDDDLLKIAPGRRGSLAGALAASPDVRHRRAAERLDAWRTRAMRATPFRFYADLLGRDGGRRRMLARLGPEAGDAIDEFLRLALRHERTQAPSLTAFLHELESADLSIKRDMEAAGDSVRVMTVHAAKGLELKIVFLPDTCGEPGGRHDPKLFGLRESGGPGFIVWSRGKESDPHILETERAAWRAAQEAEYRRLLYVAMTRAEERLYIAGFHGVRPPGARCWYNLIRTELEPLAEAATATPDAAAVLRLGKGMRLREAGAPSAPPAAIVLPSWLSSPARLEAPVAPPISPSTALAAADQIDAPALAGLAARDGATRGRLMHGLLQYLPGINPVRRAEAAARFLAARAAAMEGVERHALAAQALDLLAEARLAPLFGPGSQAEVPVAGRMARPGRTPLAVAGQIDRLAVTSDAVLIADYKSGRLPPGGAPPEAYVAQLALYRAVIQPLYPDRPVRAVILWTAGPVAQETAPAALDAALARLLA